MRGYDFLRFRYMKKNSFGISISPVWLEMAAFLQSRSLAIGIVFCLLVAGVVIVQTVGGH